MSLKDYIIRDIQEKFKYLPSAVYLALICIAMYIFVCLLRYLFTMREVSQADERRKKIVGKIWHMLFCGTFVAYMYTLIMIVYYSREPGSRTRRRRYGAVEQLGHDTSDARLFYRKYSIVYTIWAYISIGF